MISLGPQLADWARSSEALLQQSLASPTPTTLAVVFAGGLLTSLGPCSLSLLPVTLAYLAGFGASAAPDASRPSQPPWQRSLCFAAGIVGSLVLLGLVSGLLGRIYGQIPGLIPTIVAVLALGLLAAGIGCLHAVRWAIITTIVMQSLVLLLNLINILALDAEYSGRPFLGIGYVGVVLCLATSGMRRLHRA